MAKSKYDKDKVLAAIESTVDMGATMAQIATACGISQCTLYEWVKKYPEISEPIARARCRADAPAENAVYKAVLKGDVNAAKWWLINRQRGEWSETNRVEVSGPEGKPIETAALDYAEVVALYGNILSDEAGAAGAADNASSGEPVDATSTDA